MSKGFTGQEDRPGSFLISICTWLDTEDPYKRHELNAAPSIVYHKVTTANDVQDRKQDRGCRDEV